MLYVLIEGTLSIPPHQKNLIDIQFKEQLEVIRVNFLLEYNYKLAHSEYDHPELQGNFLYLYAKSIAKKILDYEQPKVIFLLSELAVQQSMISMLHEANIDCFVFSPRFQSFVKIHNQL
jgi:hypothetical protein